MHIRDGLKFVFVSACSVGAGRWGVSASSLPLEAVGVRVPPLVPS